MTEQFFLQYLNGYRPHKTYWNYEDGCVLLGCQRLYHATGDRFYADFVLDYLASRVSEDGTIPSYPAERHSLDSFHCSKSLFFAAEQTGEARYEKAIHWQAAQISEHPRTKSGLCWHKEIYPHQIWIDGVYMTAPFYAQYAEYSGNPAIYKEIGRWFHFLFSNMRNPENGLYYHALDEARVQFWANPQTGLSTSHWLRGEGWFLMALTDTIALLPDAQDGLRQMLAAILRDAVDALLQFRADDGLFCQVIDKPGYPGNYAETSGSLMAACAMMHGAALHALHEDAYETGLEILETVKRTKLRKTENGMELTAICGMAGLGGDARRDGSLAYYLSEPAVSNDPKGVGALMTAEAIRLRTAVRSMELF